MRRLKYSSCARIYNYIHAALEILERHTNIFMRRLKYSSGARISSCGAWNVRAGARVYWKRAPKLLKHLALHTAAVHGRGNVLLQFEERRLTVMPSLVSRLQLHFKDHAPAGALPVHWRLPFPAVWLWETNWTQVCRSWACHGQETSFWEEGWWLLSLGHWERSGSNWLVDKSSEKLHMRWALLTSPKVLVVGLYYPPRKPDTRERV